MKVLQVIDNLEIGGAERVFIDTITLLLNENITTDALLISGEGPLKNELDKRAGYYFLNRKNKYNTRQLLACAAICARYDVVHVHMRHTYSYVMMAKLISFKKFPIILHDHFGDIALDDSVSPKLKGIFKPKWYIGVSQQLVDWSVKKLQVDINKTFLLRNIILPLVATKAGEKKGLVIVSNIRQTKNIELAIALAEHLQQPLTIYGNIFESDYTNKIMSLLKASEYAELIQGERTVQPYLHQYSIAIHTAHSETGPLVLMEYLAHGLPFLAHNTGEVASLLSKEIPQCFIDTLDENEWIIRIQQLQQSPPSATLLKDLFYKYFGVDKYTKDCIAIYNKVLQRS